MSKAKYKKGALITSLDELASQELVYVNDKITHCGWFLSWQFRLAKDYIERGVLYRADRRDEE